MTKHFVLRDLKPFSINATYFRGHHGVVKTGGATDWTYQVFHQLDSENNQVALRELREFFNPKQHVYTLELCAVYPASEFITKAGEVSAKTQDITNWEKGLVDCFFLPKHFDRPAPYGVKNLNIDDKYVVSCKSTKASSGSSERGLLVTITIEPLAAQPTLKLNV